MKKVTFLLLLLVCSLQVVAQVLNQPANWPNANWTITGTYDAAPLVFVADPTITANFAYDDDEAGSGTNNDIAAESPIIDLTDAFNAGETWLFVNALYVYNNIGADNITLQYWNADSSTWINWMAPIVTDTPGAPTSNFCGGTNASFDSGELNIANFTTTQLSGFKYRIKYDDGDAWAWGFCFSSPTLSSQTPPACPNPNTLAVNGVGGNTATVTWNPTGSEASWEYVIQAAGSGVPTTNGVSISEPMISFTDLDYSVAYEVYVRANCGNDTFGSWVGPINFTTTEQRDFTVDCTGAPSTLNFCYTNGGATNPVIYTFTSTDGTSLNLTFNAGMVETGWDELVVIDTDGSFIVDPADLFYGNGGDLTGLSYQSTGDTISFYINSDGVFDCSSEGFTPIDVSVTCATCTNPTANYTVRSDCFTGPQFFVDVDVTSLGSATSLSVTDNQGSSPQTVTAPGLVTFGPFANATDVQITLTNDGDPNCVRTSTMLTQPFCLDTLVDCTAGPFTTNYCYANNDDNTFSYTSSTGTPLNLTINSGEIEGAPFDFLVILDSDGVTELYNGEGNNGVLDGLTFQSTGDTIYFRITSDGSVSCTSGTFGDGIDYTVVCATCVNPTANYTVRSDCFTGPQFFVDVDVTSLGSATSLSVTDNQGSSPQILTAPGLVTFGPFANATDVQITLTNDDDSNCVRTSTMLTQPFCLDTLVDCTAGPFTTNYCYANNDDNTFSYTSSTGTPLNLTINSGEIEGAPFDFLVILDSDGVTELYNGEGNNGVLDGLTFQSTGDTIYFRIISDGSVSCTSGTFGDGIDYTVACATCINPAATYSVIDDCANGDQFLIDVNVTSLGDATSLTITDDQGSPGVQVSATGVVQFGPYPFVTPVVITVSNDQDVNCVINSSPIQVLACPPANDACTGAIVAAVNPDENCNLVTPGTILAATPSGVPGGTCSGNPNDDVWFQFTAIGNQQIITLQNLTGGTTNLDHAVYSGSCDNLVQLYCSPDLTSLTPELTIGETYYIRVFSAGAAPDSTTFNLCISTLQPPTFCLEALPICAGFTYPSEVGDNVASPYLDYGCLFTQPDPTWYTLLFDEAGNYQFTIDQDTADPNNNDDIDFIIWGPYNNQQGACVSLLPENIADCSYSASDIENINLNNVQPGDIFVLLITNYGQAEGTYSFTQDSGPTGGTNCEVVCGATVVYDGNEVLEDTNNPGFGMPIDLCGVDTITLTATSPYADTFEWYEDNIPMDIYTQTLTVTQSGVYSVVVSGDVCDAPAQSIQIPVTLLEEPVANIAPDMVTCDDVSGDGVEPFNLESQTATILGNQDPTMFNVTYHLTSADADNNVGALTSPYSNISNPQQIWVRIENANSSTCAVSSSSFNLVISGATPTATSVDMVLCDDLSGDGFESFDLTLNDVNILNGQSATDFSVTYYATMADADAQVNPLTSPYTNSSNPQTIYARVDNNAATNCYAIAAFDLNVSTLPVANASPDLAGCDTDANNIAEYDFTANENTITDGQAGLTVSYYETMADATAGTSPIGNPTNYETPLTTVYVRVENTVSGCFNVTEFNLIAGVVPVTTFATNFDYEVCPDATSPIIISVNPQNYTADEVSIEWLQDGVVIPGESGLTLPVLTQGLYEIQVTFNATGCTNIVGQEIIELDNCIIPQGISPDGDGKNDTFDLSNFGVQKLEIFNRLGRMVYSKDNYTNEWHGQTDNGDELPVGTYFYTMIYENGAKQRSSWVYINK